MEHTNQIRRDSSVKNSLGFISNQNTWTTPKVQEKNARKPAEYYLLEERNAPLVEKRAPQFYWHLYHHACDQFKRADRDLGETAAFVAASLTTATAIEAVMTVANDKLGLSKNVLQEGFYVYIGIFVLILIFGFIRGRRAIQKRASAEKEIDKAKTEIFRYFPDEQWPKSEG